MADAVIRDQGIHGAGSRNYTPTQYHRVVNVIRNLSAGEVTTVAALSARTSVPGRTIREIVSAADGEDILLGGSGNGYRQAVDAADAARLTARMGSQVSRMADRVQRRRCMAEEMFG